MIVFIYGNRLIWNDTNNKKIHKWITWWVKVWAWQFSGMKSVYFYSKRMSLLLTQVQNRASMDIYPGPYLLIRYCRTYCCVAIIEVEVYAWFGGPLFNIERRRELNPQKKAKNKIVHLLSHLQFGAHDQHDQHYDHEFLGYSNHSVSCRT